jgi:DNA-binding response OmpR family regulator
MTVLLVEDDPDVRGMLENFLEKIEDVTLEVATNGSDALGLSLRSSYNLILLDLHLPDVGGLDILPVLRGSLPRSVIAVVSGYTDLVTEDDFELADVVIEKPFELNVMEALIDTTRDIDKSRRKIRSLGNHS